MVQQFALGIQQPDVGNYFTAYRTGVQDKAMQDQQKSQQALKQYVPGALQGDQQALQQVAQLDPELWMKLDDRQKAEAKDKAQRLGSYAMAFDTPEKWAANVPQVMRAMGIDGAPPGFDQRDRILSEAMSIKDQIDRLDADRTFKLKEQTTQSALRKDNAEIGLIGAQTSAAAAKASQTGGKAPAGYVWSPDGASLLPLPGGPADPARKLTEGQSKDLSYYRRGTAANNKLTPDRIEALKSGYNSTVEGAPFGFGNALVTSSARQGKQAAMDFIAALLRKDTGAAVTPQEFDFYANIYIPKWGDDEVTLRQKAASRAQALESIKAGLGGAGSLTDNGPQPTNPAMQDQPQQAPTQAGQGPLPPPPPGFVVR